ncbi:MAG: protein-glutamate O-methyltransferase [bacterium]|jgi:chemotaxis protein methyltransferase CheR|nr:protein-glutamate O-methyltransferase [bacterium]
MNAGRRDAAVLDRPAATGMTPAELAAYQKLLFDQTGIVLQDNKRALVEARVSLRLRALGMASFGEYLELLRQDRTGEELVQLIDAVSTNVTHFFREDEHFQFLSEVTEGWARQGTDRLRIWSAACSTGEEPYSIAMTVGTANGRRNADIRILATDISTRVLAEAEAGRYPEARLSTVPEARRRTCFTRVSAGGETLYEVKPELRRLVMFRRLNFKTMPYPIRGTFDVIFCRNAMIYFDRPQRERMVREFARLLKPGGYLLVGHAETLIGMSDCFRVIRPSIYERLKDGVRP